MWEFGGILFFFPPLYTWYIYVHADLEVSTHFIVISKN